MAYYGRDIAESPLLRSISGDLLQVNTDDAVNAIWGTPSVSQDIASATEQAALEDEGSRQAYNALRQLGGMEPIDDSPVLEPEILNEEFGWSGAKFDRAMPRDAAEIIAQENRAEALRNDVLARAPDTWTSSALRFGTALVSEAVDPLGAATMFVPIVGEARLAGVLARAGGAAERFGIRSAAGVAEGVAVGAPLAALEYTASQRLQLDYTMSDALIETAFGGILGGGFHSIGGAIGDIFRRVSPNTQREAFKGAVAQAVNGRNIDTTSYFAMDRVQRLRNDLMTSTTLTPSGRVALPDPVGRDVERAVEVESSPRQGRVPINDQTFDNRRAAEVAASRIEEGATVVRRTDGRYALVQDLEVDAIRNTDGTPRQFNDKRRASKAASRMGRDWRAVEVEGRWYAARLNPQQAKASTQNPELFDFGDASDLSVRRAKMADDVVSRIPENQPAIRDAVRSILERSGRVQETVQSRTPREIIAEVTRRESDPANESMADPVASTEANRVAQQTDDIDPVAVADEIDALRRSGQFTEDDEKFMAAIDNDLDQYAEFGRRAAFCMTRNA